MTRAILVAAALALAACGGEEPRPCATEGEGTCLDGHLLAKCQNGEWQVTYDCRSNTNPETRACYVGPGWYSLCPDLTVAP